MTTQDFERETKKLIDSLKGICSSYGLGNDGNEFKIITQVFLYKFLNDKFAYEAKQNNKTLAKAEKWEVAYSAMSADDKEFLLMALSADTARLRPQHLISHLFDIQNSPDFAKTFDETLRTIANENNDIFAVKTETGAKITLFDNVSEFISDNSKRDAFCKAVINKLVHFSFEKIFKEKYDFYATIFEYLIKDYNNDSGGKYAEYYTPHAVAKIMAAILVQGDVKNVTCYDPSAGSGTLLMNIAHAIGEKNCTIYSQDISQKSSSLLRLNLVLNNLVHSIQNIIQGNTILHPYHREGEALKKFDYIVSNPPFKMDFSDFRDDLDSKENHERFFAGIPNVPAKKLESMSIYSLFLQHIIFSLKQGGKAAVVVPTGFITAQSGIDRKIREKLIDEKMLAGVVSMPSNIFATTGTNVSIVFIDRSNKEGVVLIDASNLGKKVKEGKNQKTVLSPTEEDEIINTFNNKIVKEDLSVVVSYDEVKAKNYSFSAGQYFDVKIEYVDITKDAFEAKMKGFSDNLESMFAEGRVLEEEIKKQLKMVGYE
ncbi:MAG: SAM-dependent DNA methyltransferase [Epsilonproteobacteria bacterium]|nr:SAM-dependent DNA methyltransferase [Campylobacterota bacterium]OIO16791.1 MAG: SAM-dependent methyltransferase [Helicobacteraceae bacterium CG1_02_36_14]PIP10054.1 MAG: SAM-dependent methyltransferase [Sulfurimonas sp. CG23_combo_of_CG06-09_8_20_14_all_36_33]PIS23650.1 MAG: SAM-dependent methyltransferase [Sulfurimonas sp. CG08_land_8_20_14_0_20_36_33]PIU34847.1 MAG: SAM-dependent methyltransferase [Sulfurimonas sp. CG07_land_8_20_14_0_80_36_56]PIV05105.1 MAG: SAM-dependent methyltransfera